VLRFCKLGALGVILLAVSISPAVSAQDAAKLKAAQIYVSSVPFEGMITKAFTAEKLGIPSSSLTAGKINELYALLNNMMARQWPRLEQIAVEHAAETFTLSELNAMNAFNATPEGKAILTKTGPFMQSSMIDMAPVVTSALQALTPEIRSILDGE
jgi:hypothetical protein